MAAVPCEIHGGRFRGPATYLYPAIVNGVAERRARLRLCPDCAADYRDFAQATLAPAQEALPFDSDNVQICAWCKLPGGDLTWAVFLTAYWTRDERADMYGRVHDACATHMAGALHVPEDARRGP